MVFAWIQSHDSVKSKFAFSLIKYNGYSSVVCSVSTFKKSCDLIFLRTVSTLNKREHRYRSSERLYQYCLRPV